MDVNRIMIYFLTNLINFFVYISRIAQVIKENAVRGSYNNNSDALQAQLAAQEHIHQVGMRGCHQVGMWGSPGWNVGCHQVGMWGVTRLECGGSPGWNVGVTRLECGGVTRLECGGHQVGIWGSSG